MSLPVLKCILTYSNEIMIVIKLFKFSVSCYKYKIEKHMLIISFIETGVTKPHTSSIVVSYGIVHKHQMIIC